MFDGCAIHYYSSFLTAIALMNHHVLTDDPVTLTHLSLDKASWVSLRETKIQRSIKSKRSSIKVSLIWSVRTSLCQNFYCN